MYTVKNFTSKVLSEDYKVFDALRLAMAKTMKEKYNTSIQKAKSLISDRDLQHTFDMMCNYNNLDTDMSIYSEDE